eukprot:sb/3466382/
MKNHDRVLSIQTALILCKCPHSSLLIAAPTSKRRSKQPSDHQQSGTPDQTWSNTSSIPQNNTPAPCQKSHQDFLYFMEEMQNAGGSGGVETSDTSDTSGGGSGGGGGGGGGNMSNQSQRNASETNYNRHIQQTQTVSGRGECDEDQLTAVELFNRSREKKEGWSSSSSNQPRSSSNQVSSDDNTGPNSSDNSPGSSDNSPGSSDNSPGSSDNSPGSGDNSPVNVQPDNSTEQSSSSSPCGEPVQFDQKYQQQSSSDSGYNTSGIKKKQEQNSGTSTESDYKHHQQASSRSSRHDQSSFDSSRSSRHDQSSFEEDEVKQKRRVEQGCNLRENIFTQRKSCRKN